nr:hypothetical protein [Tanacetum cinerariifolium]
MSVKRTSWNEFSSAMASAVICLSTGDDVQDQCIPSPTPPTSPPQQLRDLPSTSQVQPTPPQLQSPPQAQPQAADFLMSLLQEALDACAALTRRVEHLEYDKVAQALDHKAKKKGEEAEERNKVKVLKLRRLKKVGTSQRINTSDDIVMEDASNQERMIDALDSDLGVVLMDDKEEEKKAEEAKVASDDQVQGMQAKIYKIDLDHASKVLSMQEDEPDVQEVVDVVTTTKLITEVVTAASESVTTASTTIAAAEPQVPAATITAAPVRVAAASTKRRKGLVIRDPKEESTTIIPAKTKSKDKGKGIMVGEPKPMKKKQQVEMDEEYARKLHEELNKDIKWDVANDNTSAQKAAKRRKWNEEVEDLKRHLEIMPDKDDDVYTEATLLTRKVPVVDYEIIHVNNKPHYKIIRADGTHQLYVSFITLLRNFDREDLESLWSLVKERFSTSKPNNFFDDFLLTTLGAMFKRLDGQAQVWKSQRTVHDQAKVMVVKEQQVLHYLPHPLLLQQHPVLMVVPT